MALRAVGAGVAACLLLTIAQAPAGSAQARKFNVGDVVDTDGQLLKIHECRINPGGGYEECLIQGWEGGGPSSQKSWMESRNILSGMERMETRTGKSALISSATPKATAAVPQTMPKVPTARPARPAVAAAPAAAAGQCAITKYGGPVPGSVRASEALFRQKVADSYTMRSSGTFQIGVAFESFKVGAPIRNAVSNQPGIGAVRVNNGAPPNAMMYPVVSRHVVCEQGGTSVERRRVEADYYCFVTRDEEWTCGSGGSGRPPRITPL